LRISTETAAEVGVPTTPVGVGAAKMLSNKR
jgi:hypothetical protein